MAATTKRPLLSPGAAHDHRAATERFPESTDEIGSAARRGGRCGWRPSMMNEAGSVHHRCRCFLLCLCGEPRYKFEKIYGRAILGTCFVLHPLLTTPREGCSPTLIHSLAPCISVCHIGCTESVAWHCYYHVIIDCKTKVK